MTPLDIRQFRHRVRNHINTISGYCQILSDGTLGPLSEKQITAIEIIHRNCLQVSDLMEEVQSPSGKENDS